MANSPQARKRARQNDKARMRNRMQASEMRTHIKTLIKAIDAKELEKAQLAYRKAVSAIDTAARKGLHKGSKAARLKSRLNARLKAIA